MIRVFTTISLIVLLSAGFALGLRAALKTAAERQTQSALERSAPLLAKIGHELTPAKDQSTTNRGPSEAAAIAALHAADILGQAARAPRAPGIVGAQTVELRQSLGDVSKGLTALAQASQQAAPLSSVLSLAVNVAARLERLDQDQLRRRGAGFDLPQQFKSATLEVAWQEAWTQDLRGVDAVVDQRAQDWLTWQQRDLPNLIRQDQWTHLDEKTANDLEAMARLRERFEALAPPPPASTASETYLDAIDALQMAHRHLRNYLAGKAAVPRELRLAGEALASYESSRTKALRAVDDLLVRPNSQSPRT